MAIETLVPDVPKTTGKKLTKVVPNPANTYKFANDGDTLLIVVAKATETKVKVVPQEKVDGLVPPAREVACKEGEFVIGPFNTAQYNNEEGQVEVSFSSGTEIEVFIVKSS